MSALDGLSLDGFDRVALVLALAWVLGGVWLLALTARPYPPADAPPPSLDRRSRAKIARKLLAAMLDRRPPPTE